MKNGLLEINELEGVWGSVLCSSIGKSIESVPPPGFHSQTLENISKHAIELLATTDQSVTGLREAVIHYSERTIFVLDLEQAVLVVYCSPRVDISLLRMSINVVTTRWLSDPKLQKQLKIYAVK
ncbi:MAG: hypothetical protein MUO54_01205 [Anaerolineales bacterium]|nr:hypothetical protein [Anaerolineales bacterium]